MHAVKDPRFHLVNDAHCFLTSVLPFRAESEYHLDRFVHRAAGHKLPPVDVEAVLLRCLDVLDRSAPRRMLRLVETYLADDRGHDCASRFSATVSRVLRLHAVRHPVARAAMELVDKCYASSLFSEREAARALGLRPSALSVLFVKYVGVSFSMHLKGHRLTTAARLLSETTGTVKEIWASVGYSHASTFAHDFKARYGRRATEVRRNGLGASLLSAEPEDAAPRRVRPANGTAVLVVDDDERITSKVSLFLGHEGYAAWAARTTPEALEKVEHEHAAVALVEWHLDGPDGLELLRRVRRRFGARPAVAVWSADLNLETRQAEVVALGGSCFSKLCTVDDIVALMASLAPIHADADPVTGLLLRGAARGWP